MSKEIMIPLSDRVIVKVDDAETMTKGGIIIPDAAKEIPLKGEVVAVGPGSYYNGEYEPMGLEVGERVVFNKFAGKEYDHEGEEFKVMRIQDIDFKLGKA